MTRRSLPPVQILLALLLIGCGGISSLLFAWTGEEEPLNQVYGVIQLGGNLLRVPPRTSPLTPIAHTEVNPFGINVFLEQEVEPWKRERAVQMIAEAGFHWIRQEFPWEDIEIHGKGDFEDRRNDPPRSAWEKYDHIVGLAEQYGLELVVRLSNPPAWSRADGDARGPYAPPDDLEDYGDYVHTVASHYRGRIRYYQVWNEPNIYPEWGEQPINAQEYTRLLCLAYRRIKEADPSAVVISGALAQTISLDPGPGPVTGVSDLVFLQQMYDAGAGDCFDILAVNDYILWSGPTDHRLVPQRINFARILYLRDIMVVNGDEHKPIWISEMNSNAVPDDPQIQDRGRYGQVTLEQQARYAPLAYQRAMEEWPWVGVVNFWFFKRPSDAERGQSWYYFRMVEPDFTPMPVYDSMREYITGLTPTLYRGVHQEDHWALTYEGEWEKVEDEEAVLGGYRLPTGQGGAVTFTFRGNRLVLLPGPGEGEIEVSVDGRPARRVTLRGRPVRLYFSLREGEHHVRISWTAGTAGVDALVVEETAWEGWVVPALFGLAVLAYLIRRQYRSAGLPSPTRRA